LYGAVAERSAQMPLERSGEGGVWGTLIGVLIMQTILNGLTLMNISSFFQDIVTGVVLLLAVLLGVLRSYLARR
jgi:ribose transport system permease protein